MSFNRREPLSTGKISSEKLTGFIDRVTFHNEETGFCILKVKRGHKDIVTLTAQAIQVLAAKSIEAAGAWLHHKEHGLQFGRVEKLSMKLLKSKREKRIKAINLTLSN